jgi:hypothetical protein
MRDDRQPGTEDLERSMRPGRAREFALIYLLVAAMLLVFNSGGLVRWTQALPSTAANAWIADRAGEWHALMLRLGPAARFERLREEVRRDF